MLIGLFEEECERDVLGDSRSKVSERPGAEHQLPAGCSGLGVEAQQQGVTVVRGVHVPHDEWFELVARFHVAVDPPLMVSSFPKNADTLGVDQRVLLSFNQPVIPGDGRVHIDVYDKTRSSLLYDSLEDSSLNVLKSTDDPFTLSINLQRFPFYPYALYNVLVCSLSDA